MAGEHARGRGLDAAAALLGLALLAAWMHPAALRPLTWDEVDYVVAARAGTWANLSDQGTMGPATFARFALAKTGGGDAEAVAAAAGSAREALSKALLGAVRDGGSRFQRSCGR